MPCWEHNFRNAPTNRPPLIHFRVTFVVAAALILLAKPATGQASLFIPTDDPVYQDIRRAQLQGALLSLNPVVLPYTYQEVVDALSTKGRRDPLLDRIRRVAEAGIDQGAGFSGRAGVQLTSHARLDALRHLEGGDPVYPFLESGLHWIDDQFIARAGFRHDMFWDVDPDGLDAVNRAFMRNEQSYAGLSSRRASIHAGRIQTRWSSPGGPASLLSDNARSFDALHLRLGSDRLTLRSVIGELDSITGDGRFTGLAGDDSVSTGSERRWMAAHRLDWRPSDRLVVTFMEAVLFSGPGTGLSLKYLNPAQFAVLSVDNRPKNNENNALLGLGVWFQSSPWTVEAQLMLDDLDLEFGTEPASFAAGLSIDRVVSPDLVVSGRADAVASRAYNAFQPEGRWQYLNRGLATQFSDFVHLEAGLDWNPGGYPALSLQPYIAALWQGERDLRDPFRFDDSFDTILVGVTERTMRGGVKATYTVGNAGYVRVDGGLNRVSDLGHIPGSSHVKLVVVAEAGLRWHLSGPNRR